MEHCPTVRKQYDLWSKYKCLWDWFQRSRAFGTTMLILSNRSRMLAKGLIDGKNNMICHRMSQSITWFWVGKMTGSFSFGTQVYKYMFIIDSYMPPTGKVELFWEDYWYMYYVLCFFKVWEQLRTEEELRNFLHICHINRILTNLCAWI